MGQDRPTQLGPLERASLITGQTPVSREQPINTRQQVPSVGDKSKITIKDPLLRFTLVYQIEYYSIGV
jgi:hypothetical protein